MVCVFCWQHYDRSSSAADSNILDEVKKVMNILYHRLQPQFVPSMSYDGLQIRHSFMATIRVYAQNLFTFLVLVFKWITKAANCLMWIVPVSQSSHNIYTKDLMQDSKFLQHCLLRSILGCDTVSLGKWFPTVQRIVLPSSSRVRWSSTTCPATQHSFQGDLISQRVSWIFDTWRWNSHQNLPVIMGFL